MKPSALRIERLLAKVEAELACADALAVTTRPPFGLRTNATTARSISPASRVSIALNSTADDDARD
jgi:hypothetical protein